MSATDHNIVTVIHDGSAIDPLSPADTKKDQDRSINLNCEFNSTKFSQMLPPTFSVSSEESEDLDDEDDGFHSDINEQNVLALIEDDPNKTLEPAKHKCNIKSNPALPISEDQDGSYRGRPSSCVFVASLAASLTDDQLSISVTKHFEKWGELALVKVLRDPSNRPYAFVQYTTDEDAHLALANGHNSTLDGRTIRCEPAKVNRTLYIATCNAFDISSKSLKELLEHYGEVEQMVGNKDLQFRKSNLNKAWFCKFAYRDDAIRAYANLRVSPDYIVEWAQNIDSPSHSIAKLETYSSISNDEPEVVIDKFSVFVGQLDSRVTKEKLSDRFSRHGKIEDVVLVLKPGNNFAFIKFATEKAAGAAVERENHAVFLDKTMHVQYRELHHKKSRNSSVPSPRLSLAPPPVNLPYRRASVGSSYYPKPAIYDLHSLNHYQSIYHPSTSTINTTRLLSSGSNKKSAATTTATTNVSLPRVNRFKQVLTRSASLDNQRDLSSIKNSQRFFSQQYGTGISNIVEHNYSCFPNPSNRSLASTNTPSKSDSYGNSKQTPLSSPSNHTNESSPGEAKSLYSSSTVSALESQLQETSISGHHSKPIPNQPLQRPPSSYYYYAPVSSHSHVPPPPPPPGLQKEPYLYEPSSYLTYASYPYYYPSTALIDYNAGALNGNPAPYYMYYGIPQTPGAFPNSKPSTSIEQTQFDDASRNFPQGSPGEIDY